MYLFQCLGLNLRRILQTGKVIQFEGDSREFTPHAVNTMRSRVEQEVVVDFYKEEVFSYANTGITTEKSYKSRWFCE